MHRARPGTNNFALQQAQEFYVRQDTAALNTEKQVDIFPILVRDQSFHVNLGKIAS